MRTNERSDLFAMLRQMESDTVRMYDAALDREGDGAAHELRELRGGHERHVRSLDDLLGGCETDIGTTEQVRRALDGQVRAVRDASARGEMIERLWETERTLAAEYAVAEEAHLTADEARSIGALHEDEHAFVNEIASRLTGGGGTAAGGSAEAR